MDKYDKIDFGDGQNTNSGDTLYDAFTKVNNAFDNIENDINVVDTKLDDFIYRVEVDVAQLDDLLNDLDDKKADKTELNSEVNRLDNDINNLNVELTNTNNNIIDLTNDVDDKLALKADKSFLDAEIIRIDNSIIDLTNDVDDKLDSKADKSFLDAEIIRIDNSIIDLTNEVDDKLDLKADKSFLDSEVNRLDNDIIDLTNEVDDKLDLKADKLTTYTKVEIDGLFTNVENELTNYYDKDETNSLLDDKVNNSELTNYYNKTEVDGLLINKVDNTQLADYATIIDLNSGLATKANQLTTYTKVEVDNLIQNVEVDLTGYATETYVNNAIDAIDIPTTDLSNYYDKTETYNKTEVDDLVANSGGEVDLSNYYNKTEVDNKVVFGSGASGSNGVAVGFNSNGSNGVAVGAATKGQRGVGIGQNADGYQGVAIGANSKGRDSVAIGTYALNYSYRGIAIGFYNDPILTSQQYSINLEHPLFIIGNGINSTSSGRSNAFVMWQNGKSQFTNIASYKEDYSSNFSELSLVNKKYVDDLVANSGGGGEIDLSNYYTKLEVNDLIENVEVGLSNYYNKSEVDNQLKAFGNQAIITTSTTISKSYNNNIILADSPVDIIITVPSGTDNYSFVVRNMGVGKVTINGDGTNSLHATSVGNELETSEITSVIVNNNLIITT